MTLARYVNLSVGVCMFVYDYFIKGCVSPIELIVIEEVVDPVRGVKVSILVCLSIAVSIKDAAVLPVSPTIVSSVKRTLEVPIDEDGTEVSVVV